MVGPDPTISGQFCAGKINAVMIAGDGRVKSSHDDNASHSVNAPIIPGDLLSGRRVGKPVQDYSAASAISPSSGLPSMVFVTTPDCSRILASITLAMSL